MGKDHKIKLNDLAGAIALARSSAGVCDDGKERLSLNEVHVGPKATIIHCQGSRDSYFKAVKSKSWGKKKIRSMEHTLAILIERLGRGELLTSDVFPQEGLLPDGSKFRAFKKIPIRAYLWLSKRRKNVYFISHYVVKLVDDLDQRDTDQTCRNWTRIEVNDEER